MRHQTVDEPAFAAAWRAGRQRRRKKLLLSGSGSLAVCAAVIASITAVSTARTGSLEQLDPATGATASPQALTATAPQLSPREGASVQPPRSASSPGSSSRPRTAATDAPQGAGYRGSPSRSVTRTYREAAEREGGGVTVGGGPGAFCGVDAGTTASAEPQWCTGSDVSPSDADLRLVHYACSYDSDTQSLSFRTTQEVDYEIHDARGRVVWRWSSHARVMRAAHTLSAHPSGCFAWTTVWSPLTAAGTPLPAGDYVMRAWVTARELGPSAYKDEAFSYAGPQRDGRTGAG